jgi:hypothetical protein
MNNYKIINRRDNKIANIIFKETLIEELKTERSYSRAMFDITKHSLLDTTNNSIFELDGDCDLEKALSDAKMFGFKIAVIWFEGNWVKDHTWEDELLKEVKRWDEDGKWLCAGHILARKNRTPEFHNQCIVINLDVHRMLYLNTTREATQYPNFSMSEEHLHDDYTPMYLKSSEENQNIDDDIPQFDNKSRMFDILRYPIMTALKHGCSVHNFNYDLRSLKSSAYPEDDIIDTKMLFFSVMKEQTDAEVIRYTGLMLEEDKLEMFDHLYDSRKQIELVKDTSISDRKPYKNLGSEVALLRSRGGDKLKFIIENIDTLKHVVFYDDNDYSLEIFQYIVENWNGKDLVNFYQKYVRDHPDDEIRTFLEHAVIYDEDENLDIDVSIIEKLKDIKFSYNKFIPVKRANKVASFFGCVSMLEYVKLFEEYNKCFIEFDNIWIYPYYRVMNDRSTKIFDSYYSLLNSIEDNFEEVIISGYDPHGNLYQNLNTRLL